MTQRYVWIGQAETDREEARVLHAYLTATRREPHWRLRLAFGFAMVAVAAAAVIAAVLVRG